MQLVPTLKGAIPFGLESAAQAVADDVAAAYAAAPCLLAQAFGRAPEITVVPHPDDTPYGPWFSVQVKAGDEIRYIAE